jgi:hypothetical protein
MPEPIDIYGTAFKNGSATLLARVVGAGGAHVVPADLSAIRYSVYLLDDQDADSRTAVAGHTSVAVPVAGAVLDAVQQDALWTVDQVGYNFRHVLDVSTAPAFPIAGRRYLVEFQLTPLAGQVILVRFRVNVI